MHCALRTIDYAVWLAVVTERGMDTEPDGTGRIIAHLDGEEYGWWDDKYGGAGYGELYNNSVTARAGF